MCDHLLVENICLTKQIVGTYRLQTGKNAAQRLTAYYCAQEFEFSVFEQFRAEMVECGRACVHQTTSQSLVVLGLLWKGLRRLCPGEPFAGFAFRVQFAFLAGSRHRCLIPLTPSYAAKISRPRPKPRTTPCPVMNVRSNQFAAEPVSIPKLLRAYLTLGAKICGAPALDRQFKTIDFLTVLDLATVSPPPPARGFWGEVVLACSNVATMD